MDFFQQFGIDVPPIGVALEDPERLEEQEDQLKNLVDLIPQQGITEIKLPRTEQTTERYLTPDKSQRKPKRKKPKGYDATKGGSYMEYGTEDAMVGINKQLLDYANAIEKLPKKKPKKRKGIASASVTRHDSGVPMTAVTDASAFGHELRDQNTVKEKGMKVLLEVLKHLPGQHNQADHAGGRGKKGSFGKQGTPSAGKGGSWSKSGFADPKDAGHATSLFRERMASRKIRTQTTHSTGWSVGAQPKINVSSDDINDITDALGRMGFEKDHVSTGTSAFKKGKMRAYVKSNDDAIWPHSVLFAG